MKISRMFYLYSFFTSGLSLAEVIRGDLLGSLISAIGSVIFYNYAQRAEIIELLKGDKK